MSIGRLARTVWELDPRQIVGRAGFRARREIWPLVRALPSLPTRDPRLPRRDALPATAPLDEADLEALARGTLRLAGREALLPDDPPFQPSERDPLYRYQLHEHGWLREAMTRSPALRPRLSAWLDRYTRADFARRSVALDPYPLATRVREWQGLVSVGLRGSASMAAPMGQAARMLFGLSETHLLANHLLRDRAAMVVAAAWVDGAVGPWLRARAATLLAAECDAQFGSDGMHEERCPAYHAHACMDLLFALDALPAANEERRAELERARDAIRAHAERAISALELVTHADDRVAAFGDSAPLSTPTTSTIRAWGDALALETRALRWEPAGEAARVTSHVAGFSRVRAGALECFVSHGRFGAPHQPGHAHCDLFAFELDVRGRRVVVDPGVHAYHDAEWRERTRASRSHATPSLPGREQAEIWSRFRCGWRPRAIEARWSDGTLSGEARAFGPHDVRTLRRDLRFQAGALSIRDAIEPGDGLEAAVPLAVGLRVEREGERVAHVDTGRERLLTVRLEGPGRLELEEGEVSHRFGARAPAPRLRLRGTGLLEYTLGCVPP